MIIISHNRVINWSNVLEAQSYNGMDKRRKGHTAITFLGGYNLDLTIKYDDFEQQLRNAGKANIRVLQLDY